MLGLGFQGEIVGDPKGDGNLVVSRYRGDIWVLALGTWVIERFMEVGRDFDLLMQKDYVCISLSEWGELVDPFPYIKKTSRSH